VSYEVQRLDIARLKATEEAEPAHVRRIAAEMQRDGVQRRPILVERNSLAILDGHHRYHAAKMLGLLAVSAVLIDYGDPRLTLSSWTDMPCSREAVLRAAASGVLLPPKTTRHILDPQLQDDPVALTELLGARPIPLSSAR
jgi:hypothetical protein